MARPPLILLALALMAGPLLAQDHKAFLNKYCVDCHGPKKAKADLRLDTLKPPVAGDLELLDTWTLKSKNYTSIFTVKY